MPTKENYSTYRDRDISGIIYFVRDELGQPVLDDAGNPVKLDHAEAIQIDAGTTLLADLIAARPGVYPKAAPTAQVKHVAAKKRGRSKSK